MLQVNLGDNENNCCLPHATASKIIFRRNTILEQSFSRSKVESFLSNVVLEKPANKLCSM